MSNLNKAVCILSYVLNLTIIKRDYSPTLKYSQYTTKSVLPLKDLRPQNSQNFIAFFIREFSNSFTFFYDRFTYEQTFNKNGA